MAGWLQALQRDASVAFEKHANETNRKRSRAQLQQKHNQSRGTYKAMAFGWYLEKMVQ